MHVLKVRGVDEAFSSGLDLIRAEGRLEQSRNGPVLRVPRPVTTIYLNPAQRVLTDAMRDANPFFHLMEALWILAGRDDVAFLTVFNRRMAEYSDNGETFHAAYGQRLRYHFGMDQLNGAVEELRRDPASRRVVLSIWDPLVDLGAISKDIPCNDTLKLEIVNGALDLIVFNRSNDMIWGAYGANVVQFSMLLEYLAGRIGVPMGTYTQISSNFHVYMEVWQKYAGYTPPRHGLYSLLGITPAPLVTDPEGFDADLGNFFGWWDAAQDQGTIIQEWPPATFRNTFFSHVAVPMLRAWYLRKEGRKDEAYRTAGKVAGDDWRMAAIAWMTRRDQ